MTYPYISNKNYFFGKLRYEKKDFEIIFFTLIPYVSSKKKNKQTNKSTKKLPRTVRTKFVHL